MKMSVNQKAHRCARVGYHPTIGIVADKFHETFGDKCASHIATHAPSINYNSQQKSFEATKMDALFICVVCNIESQQSVLNIVQCNVLLPISHSTACSGVTTAPATPAPRGRLI